MKRKLISLLLAFIMIFGLLPALSLPVGATNSNASSSDMDALSALGIDSSKAPDGYDPTSTGNPYGKNTIQISPVYELYKVGLQQSLTYSSIYDTTKNQLENGENKEGHSNSFNNNLCSSIYGDEMWNTTTVQGVMQAGRETTIKSGTSSANGEYSLITSGTVNSSLAADGLTTKGYLSKAANASTDLSDGFKLGLSSVASGNFDSNKSGLSAQTVMVYTSDYSKNGGLYLRFGDAKSGTYSDNAKTLLSIDKTIGNPGLINDNILVENFAENPYQLQNYLQVATGDWNGDGLDEVAVYVPEQGNSRIIVYALQLTSADDRATAYLNASKWSVVWTYYLREGDVVSNMVSLVSGDVNKDGMDDLAATWGYYYGPTQNIGSTAVVMFGAKGTQMFVKFQEFDLTYSSSDIVRATFSFGDMAGSGEDSLILSGQSDADLKVGNTQTRYVALYSWDGSTFTSNIYMNFVLFAKEDGNYVWPVMKFHNDKFYSLPLCTANTALITRGISDGGGDLLYFDSLIIEYTEQGLEIKEAWDNQSSMQQNTSNCVEYVEYGAVAGDLTGQTGAAAIITMTQTLSSVTQKTTSYNVTGTHVVPTYSSSYYYRSWVHRLFGIKSWYTYINGTTTVDTTSTITVNYDSLTMGKNYMVAVDPTSVGPYYYNRIETDFSTAICLVNTDNDSSYMNYTGSHYYTYTDPEVLAVLASPPYFSDLLNRDDLSGNYAESTTSYSKTKGSGSGFNVGATISIGAYVSFEQDISVFGVKVASVEAEASWKANFTYEMEKTSTLEQTISYNATSGEDMVAFYSIPMEIYEYESYVPNGSGGYKKVLTSVNIPHEAAVRLLSMKEYDNIAKDYSVLPSIEDNVLTHTLGDPSTYPSGTDGYNIIAKYEDTPTSVGFSSASGGSGISQEIAMSNDTAHSFSASLAVEAKAGAGAGGTKLGVIAGAEAGAGLVKISTNGNSFSGELQNMPIEAQPYGYGMNWRIFCYKYSNGRTSFPVVSYLVSQVSNPPFLPEDFEQDISATTSNSITLKWSYDKNIAGFRIFRYYEFPDGSGSHEVAFIPFTNAVRYDSATKTYYFNYKDDNLSPYTDYSYQIQAVRAVNPKESIYSEPMSCRTKTQVGYPVISLIGLDLNGKMPIYPDADGTVSASVEQADKYNALSYQWQKLVGGSWTSMSGKNTSTLTISNAGAGDNGLYRCRINAIYYDENTATNYYISAYSDPVTTAYSKRTPTYDSNAFIAVENMSPGSGGIFYAGLSTAIKLYSANQNHSTAPTGFITFTVKGTDYEYSKTVALATSSSTEYLGGAERYFSTASLSIQSLPEGVYTITAYYGGSRIFQDKETNTGKLVVIGNGSAHSLSLATSSSGNSVTKFEYGKNIFPTLVSISKGDDGIEQNIVSGVTYKLVSEAFPLGESFTTGSKTPNVGSYTLQAYINETLIVSQNFTVSKKPITIKVENETNISAIDVQSNPPRITSLELSENELTALNLTYVALNSAGNPITLNNNTDPGNYTVTAITSSTTDSFNYNNYSVSYVSGTYTIIGATYRLTVNASQYTDPSGTRTVGSAGISNASQNYSDYTAGTAVHMNATPYPGYQVDKWVAIFDNSIEKTQTGGSTYILTTEAQGVTVYVTYKPAAIKLSTVAQQSAGGTINCSDEYFTSGAVVSYGAEFSFTATPKAGYHFSKWQTVSGGITTPYNGTAAPDGSNNLTVTVGAASMTLYAIFERDSYTLTLDGNITAYYMYDDDNNISTPPIPRFISSGGPIVGDTLITVQLKTGYQAADESFFNVDGITTSEDIQYVFNITKNTTISLDTVRNKYNVAVSAINGTVAATISNIPATEEQLSSVEGGSTLTFTARADRGYIFDHWILNEIAIADTSSTLTITQLGENIEITAVYSVNTSYTAAAVVSVASRGIMRYTLYDIYGDLVGTSISDMPVGGLTVYAGESITFDVSVNSGSTIEQWDVNGSNTYTNQKTYLINDINSNINAVAFLKAASSYSVYFISMGIETDNILTAKSDGVSFISGNLQFGGSELVFTAIPAPNRMIDHWTVTAGDPMIAENTSSIKDSEGNMIIAPALTIDPLKQNITVRAHFTTLLEYDVTVPDTAFKGVSNITYITPVSPTDDGARASTSENVRSGGEVRMSFTPEEGYATNDQRIKSLLEEKINSDATVQVEKENENYKVRIKNLKSSVTLTEEDIYYNVYVITVPAKVSVSTSLAAEGEIVTLTVTPDFNYQLSTLTLSNGTLNEQVIASRRIYTFEMPASPVTITVNFVLVFTGGGDIGGGDIGGGDTGGGDNNDGADDPESLEVPSTSGADSLKVSMTVNGDVAKLNLNTDAHEDISAMSGTLSFDLSSFENITGVTIPSATFMTISGTTGLDRLDISLPDAQITFDVAAIAAMKSAGSGDVTLSAQNVDKNTLAPNQQHLVGDRPVIDLKLTVGGNNVSSFGTGSVEVRVPYTLKPGENPDNIVIWYLNSKGILESVIGYYDTVTKLVVFTTNHFSKYVVGYLPFVDVAGNEWYFNSVSFTYANSLFNGITDTTFGSDTLMTRAMFVTVIWRMDGKPTPKKANSFNDVEKGEWYTDAVSWASENKIATGHGDGMFGTEEAITREQMSLILMNYAKYKSYNVSAKTNLSSFTDSLNISNWADTSMKWACAEGLLNGIGNNLLDPQGATPRYQIAVVLQRFMMRYIK